MKKIWRRKWLVIAAAVAIFLSIGAAAWAATGSDPSNTTATTTVTTAAGSSGDSGTLCPGGGYGRGMAGLRERFQDMKERMQQRLQNQQSRLDDLSKQMTPEDKAKYDELIAKVKDQQDALQQARQNLADTVKQLRDLARKYLNTTATTAAGSSTSTTQTN
jgi:hypothetical protein